VGGWVLRTSTLGDGRQGSVAHEHLGLVLNVLDRNGDGWGEVLMAQGGYESMSLSLVEYSASGFHPTGIEYAYGC